MLTTADRSIVRRRLITASVGTVLWLLLLLSASLLLLVMLENGFQLPAPWDRGQGWLLSALLLGWGWLLRRQPRRWRALRRESRTGRVETLQGLSVVLPQRGFGWVAPMRLQLVVADCILPAGHVALLALHPGQRVQIRYLPASQTLLSVQPVAALASAVQPKANQCDWTARERMLLQQMAAGQPDKVIARECGLSPATVRTYNSAIFRKLGVSNRDDAVQAARRAGLLAVD